MTVVNVLHSFGFHLVITYSHVFVDKLIGFAQKLGIEIKSHLEIVFIEYLNKAYVLRNTVAIAERYGFFLLLNIVFPNYIRNSASNFLNCCIFFIIITFTSFAAESSSSILPR